MTLQEILNDVDTFIGNSITTDTKVRWLNTIYKEVLEVVKIPHIYEAGVTASTADYTVPSTEGMKSRNIDTVKVKQSADTDSDDWKVYQARLFGQEYRAGRYEFTAEDVSDGSCNITLYPTPDATYASTGIRIRFFKGCTETFENTAGIDADSTSVCLGESPTIIPTEYHDIFVLKLCQRLAQAKDDGNKATYYASLSKNLLELMQINYGQDHETGYPGTYDVMPERSG